MVRLVIIANRIKVAMEFMHSQGLKPNEVIIVTEGDQLRGLIGIRRDPLNGLVALYEEKWYSGRLEGQLDRRDRLYNALRAQGFNVPGDYYR